MVFLGGHRIQGLGDAIEVNRLTRNAELVTLDQLVVQVHLAQVIRMHGLWHARGVGVPEQHIEWWQFFAHQIALHPVMPNEAVGTQEAERTCHLLAVQIALFGHQILQRADAGFVDKNLDLAGMRKIGQRSQQRPVRHRHFVWAVALVGPGHVSGRQGATNTVAHQMQLRHLAEFGGGIDQFVDAFLQVVVKAHIAHVGGRVFPAADEHRKTLVSQVLDQTLLRCQVENVKLVDPGRDDQDGHGAHLWGGGRVVNQLDQPVPKNHLARRGRQVLAHGKGVRLDHLDVFGCRVAHEIVQPCLQARSPGFNGAGHGLRIEPEEIGGRHLVEPVALPKSRLTTRVAGQTGCFQANFLQTVGKRQVPLLVNVPSGRLGPDRVGKAGIFRVLFKHFMGGHAQHASQRVVVQGNPVRGQVVHGL